MKKFVGPQNFFKTSYNASNLTYNASIILKCFTVPKMLKKNASIIYRALTAVHMMHARAHAQCMLSLIITIL